MTDEDDAPSPPAPPPRLLRRRRAETAAALLPIVGAFILAPPFIEAFARDVRVLGAPLILVFLLAVWLGLILAARHLARRLGPPRA